jgi:hypothetical protein
MMDVLPCFFSRFPDVQRDLCRLGFELIARGCATVRVLLLVLGLSSRMVECHDCLLADVIPTSL